MVIYERWKCPTLEAPLPISSLGRTPGWGQEGSSLTHGSGVDSDESIWACHDGLEVSGLEWDSDPSHYIHKDTGAEIPLAKLKRAQQRDLSMSSLSKLPLESLQMEDGSQLPTHKHLVTCEETEMVQGTCQCLLALLE